VIHLDFSETCGPIPDEVRSFAGEICTASESEIRDLLSGLPARISLAIATGKRVIQQTGCTGVALAPGRAAFFYDPDRPEGSMAIIRRHLRTVLFHEFHHLTRGWLIHGGTQGSSLIDGVICEGLATAFERDFGGSRPPWGRYPENVTAWVDEVLSLPPSAPYRKWMFQHPDGRLWIGYKVGTYIADQVKRRTGLTAADLVVTDSNEVLTLAGIDPSSRC
jgi:uncharacterized protein YjaZ